MDRSLRFSRKAHNVLRVVLAIRSQKFIVTILWLSQQINYKMPIKQKILQIKSK